jgi:enoyl-CoA hydratase/carnithine racemase
MSVEESFVLTETRGAVATLTLNRPAQLNALSNAMLAALQSALDEVRERKDIRVVLLTGAGRAFCAGHDLREMRAHRDQQWLVELFARCSRVMLTINELPQPVIALVHGVATAAGCQLVAACDLALAGRSARFATSGVNLGLFCSTPAVAVTRSLAAKHAAELLFTGDFISAEQAERWGLINRSVEDAALMQTALEWADMLARKSGAALASGKAFLRKQRNLSLTDAYTLAGDNMARDMLTEDAARGIDAFLHKQPSPEWKHR